MLQIIYCFDFKHKCSCVCLSTYVYKYSSIEWLLDVKQKDRLPAFREII